MSVLTPANGRRRTPAARTEASTVLSRLRAFVEHRGYQAGDKLPPERALASELKVGRPAIREAIKALGILDVLESRRGDGTYVKSLTALTTGWPAVVEVSEQNFSMLELLEVRKIIESRAAGLAAARATEEDLREIVAAKTALDDDSVQWQQIGELDIALHAAIIKASKNSVLVSVHDCLAPLLKASRAITARSAPNWTQMRSDHAAIVEAICRGESAAAEQAMTEHMHHIGLDLISSRKR